MNLDCIIKNGNLVILEEAIIKTSIRVKDEKTMIISKEIDFMPAKNVIYVQGNYGLLGVIEPHVDPVLGSQLDEDFFAETMSVRPCDMRRAWIQ